MQSKFMIDVILFEIKELKGSYKAGEISKETFLAELKHLRKELKSF